MQVNSFINDLYQLKRLVTIKHHIPGRVRLKFSLSILTKMARFNQFKADIEQSPLIKSYRLNLSTGSLLVEYDEQIILPNLINELLLQDETKSQQALLLLTQIVNKQNNDQ
ncbi:MAG: hypothetical protein GY787_13410 [Alteromonadales bacterium]|nr:hypothetical protein [Alteromonadales bacterium]